MLQFIKCVCLKILPPTPLYSLLGRVYLTLIHHFNASKGVGWRGVGSYNPSPPLKSKGCRKNNCASRRRLSKSLGGCKIFGCTSCSLPTTTCALACPRPFTVKLFIGLDEVINKFWRKVPTPPPFLRKKT